MFFVLFFFAIMQRTALHCHVSVTDARDCSHGLLARCLVSQASPISADFRGVGLEFGK
jgi:hypothetical protein